MQQQRFWLFRRGGIFYLQDALTRRRESLNTRNRREAEQIRLARSEAADRPQFGLVLAKAYLSGQDTQLTQRTWQEVISDFCSRGKPQTQARRRRATERPPISDLADKRLVETTTDDFMNVLRDGGVMVNATLRCLQNLAVGLGWLPLPILPSKLWPAQRLKKKRGVTWAEHQRIVEAERNPERRSYYEILWETGASQADAALLMAENIDWQNRILSYQRQKTGEMASLRIGKRLETLLLQLPRKGVLFASISKSNSSARSAEFSRRCRLLNLKGISLHSYRYAWAERARSCGYPERWAQNALGHNSPAVHQAYAKNGVAICPALEDYEAKHTNENMNLLARCA